MNKDYNGKNLGYGNSNVSPISGGLAILALEDSLKKGKTITIPSLNLKIVSEEGEYKVDKINEEND
jgi:hypothetical protein